MHALTLRSHVAPDPCIDDFILGSYDYSNIKDLDFSHNNISRINPGFFKPTELSLTTLNLAFNTLMVKFSKAFNFIYLNL